LLRPLVAAAAAALTSPAIAQDSPLTTASQSTKLSVEFRSELKYSDQGLKKEDGADAPDKLTTLELQRVRVKMVGNVTPETEYKVRLNMLEPTKGVVDYASMTRWFSAFGLGIGRQKVLQGGWDQADEGYRTHIIGAFKDNFAFSNYEDMISLHVKAAGKVTLQILNDVTTADDGEWNKTAHPTWVIGWQGDFGGLNPLVQLGSYDNNKSNWLDLGFKTDIVGIKTNLDYMMHNRVHKAAKVSDGKAAEVKDTATSITVRAAYEIKDTATPWLYVSTYDNKQGDDDKVAPASKDVKFNSVTADASGKKTYHFDDNAMFYGLGADVPLGKNWTPYLAFVAKSGKFQKSPTDPDKTEAKTETHVKLGVYGEL